LESVIWLALDQESFCMLPLEARLVIRLLACIIALALLPTTLALTAEKPT